ncbi:MAG: YceI family protein [bacterium]|nr:YceI family protein [bacterium]
MEHVNTLQTESPSAQRVHSNKAIRILGIVIMGFLTLVTIGVAYIWFSGGDGTPSTSISAPSLVLLPNDTRTLFTIVPDESQVRFMIDEILLNVPKTVIGTTNEVAGELLVDFNSPANSQLGTIRVNVRTLQTDNEFRNRDLRGQILQSDRAEFEFAIFTPITLLQLPKSITFGEPFDFQIQGNLTLHGVTREIIFDATLTPISQTQITGSAWTTVNYQDFNITIPQVPGVANVSDNVRLEIDFIALPKEE